MFDHGGGERITASRHVSVEGGIVSISPKTFWTIPAAAVVETAEFCMDGFQAVVL